MRKKLITLISALLVLSFFIGCSSQASIMKKSDNYIDTIFFEDVPTFKVTSKCVRNGKWMDKISNTDHGENISPDLSWDAVDGATQYQVIMIDGNWLHMDVSTRDTSLAEGAIAGKGAKGSRYVGPYPPLGATHTYSVFVFALKNDPGKFYMGFDGGGNSINDIFKGLNTDADGNTGNVIAYGRLDGNYRKKE